MTQTILKLPEILGTFLSAAPNLNPELLKSDTAEYLKVTTGLELQDSSEINIVENSDKVINVALPYYERVVSHPAGIPDERLSDASGGVDLDYLIDGSSTARQRAYTYATYDLITGYFGSSDAYARDLLYRRGGHGASLVELESLLEADGEIVTGAAQRGAFGQQK